MSVWLLRSQWRTIRCDRGKEDMMAVRTRFFGMIAVLAALASQHGEAAQRSIRIDFVGDWGNALSLDACPGSTTANTLVTWGGDFDTYTFSGQSDPAFNFNTDTYCQITVAYDPLQPGDAYFSSASFFTGDEPGLAAMVGANLDNHATAVRYAYLAGNRFDNPNGFQWAFYEFRNEITVVGLYGLTGIPLTDQHAYISPGIWQGGTDGYDGEYFCFRSYFGVFGAQFVDYLGTWNGTLAEQDNVCLQEIATIFEDGMETRVLSRQ